MATYCGLCDRHFGSGQALIQHTEAKHGKANVHHGVRLWEDSRDQRGELTTGRAAGNYTYEVDDYDYDPYQDAWLCGVCDREFSSKQALEQHLNSGVHEEALYRCQGCDRTFRNLAHLNQHVTTTGCSSRSARQVRTMLGDAGRQSGMLMLTNHSHNPQRAPPEGTVYFDGGAQPNPGIGGAGFVLRDDRGHKVCSESLGIYNGQTESFHGVTNNQAEYVGLIMGMLEADRQGMKRILVRGDSELVIKQMQGVYQAWFR